jgi:hypothetical protein
VEEIPSKFINKQTLDYLAAQTGSTTKQRLDELTINVENLFNYLSEYEQYHDVSEEESGARFLQIEITQTKEIASLRQAFDAQIRRAVKRLMLVGLAALLGAGAVLWLVR